MKKRMICALTLIGFVTCAEESGKAIAIETPKYQAMPVLFGIVGDFDTQGLSLLQTIVSDLSFSKQFSIDQKSLHVPRSKDDVKNLFNLGYPMVTFISCPKEAATCEWRLYDAFRADMVKGRKHECIGEPSRWWGHCIAHEIWHSLTGSASVFPSKIAYIKKRKNKHNKKTYDVCIADFDGKNEKVLLSSQRARVAPHWSNDRTRPFILFSEFTDHNVRLMAVDMLGNRRSVLDVDGTTVGVSYAPTGSSVIYGRSGDIWRCDYDTVRKQAKHTLVIREVEPCASPNLLANGDIIYCSEGKINYFCLATQQKKVLTPQGYCVAPAYSPALNKVVYSKRVKGVMQLFVYDLVSEAHEQVTFGKGDKTEPSWSPCGTYIACTAEQGNSARVALVHVPTKNFQYITPQGVWCGYPSWSPLLDTCTSL